MRLTAAILALLMLALSCLPCADLEAAPVHAQRAALLFLPVSDHSGHDHEHADLCSPFCQCACCAIASELTPPVCLSLQKTRPLPLAIYLDFRPAAPVHISIPVWEPPR